MAYDVYLKGMTASGLQRYDGYRTAVGYFEQAIARQPDFAEAHAALAQSQLQFLFGGPVSPREAIPKAEAAARRAIDSIPRCRFRTGCSGRSSVCSTGNGTRRTPPALAHALNAQPDEVPGGGVCANPARPDRRGDRGGRTRAQAGSAVICRASERRHGVPRSGSA